MDTGTAELVPDDDGRRGWTLHLNGVPSSHVDLDDPRRLDFEYMRWAVAVVAAAWAQDTALQITHLGGGACTLARYFAEVYPHARQLVVELDSALLDLVRDALGLRSSKRLRLRVGDARAVLSTLDDSGQDIVIRDTFSGAEVPAHLATRQFLAEVRRTLRPGGLYLANLADRPPLHQARAEAATALAVFEQVSLIAEPAQFRGRRFGNLILVGSDRPLPVGTMDRALACDPVRARHLDSGDVRAFASGRATLTDPERAPDG